MSRRRLMIGLFVLVLTGCAAIARGTANTPAPTVTSYPRARVESPGYGFEAYLWWKPEVATRDLGLIRDAGFQWVKQTFAWRDIELEKGKKIVQEWKTTEWPKGYPPSIVELTLKPKGTKTELTMIHSKVPAEQAKSYEDGWKEFYWEPLKKYFTKT